MRKLLKPCGGVTLFIVNDALALVGAKIRAHASPSRLELEVAYDWAARTHLRASDNPRVKVPPMPLYLEMSVPDFEKDFPLLKRDTKNRKEKS